jgi:hypothetical protein
MGMTLRQKPLDEREELVVRLHEGERLTYAAVAAQLGCSADRVRQIYTNAKVRLKDYAQNKEESLLLLPMRCRNLLERCKISSRKQTRTAIESGQLAWHEHGRAIVWKGRGLREVGWKNWVVLNEWAGLPRPKSERVITCPRCGEKFEV